MQWTTLTMGEAQVDVPEHSIIHVIEEPPDDLSAMRVVRTELIDGVPCVIILTSRPWQRGWHVATVVEKFARSCDAGTVTVAPVNVAGAAMGRRLDGTIRMPDGFGEIDEQEAMTIVLARTDHDDLVSLTIRFDLGDLEDATTAVDHVVESFRAGPD